MPLLAHLPPGARKRNCSQQLAGDAKDIRMNEVDGKECVEDIIDSDWKEHISRNDQRPMETSTQREKIQNYAQVAGT
jgi:hypothetical protein